MKKKSFCTCFNFMSWFTMTLSQVNFNLLFATENNVNHYLAEAKSRHFCRRELYLYIYLVIFTQPYPRGLCLGLQKGSKDKTYAMQDFPVTVSFFFL